MPKFSVIVPIYKVEKYVAQCIESVLNQSFKDFELLAVDDCGGDNSIHIVEEYAKKDDRIKIFYHEKNKRQGGARNTALQNSTGDYIICLDSDDWMEKECLSIIYSEFKKHKTESIWFNAYSYYEDTQKRGEKPMYEQSDGFRVLTPGTIAAYADFTWIKAYTRESIQRYNLCWPENITFEDGEFYFKYFTYYPKTYVISDCLINYRYRSGSTVREANSGNIKIEDVYSVIKNLKSFWLEIGMYESYKVTLLKLIQNRIRMMKGLNYSDKNKKLSYEFMKELGYPDEFKQFMPKISNLNPLVSVVIPVYNVEKYIEDCLLSVINQTYKNLEIICVDDCGQDNSMKIVKEYAKKDKRIKIIKHKKNKGLGAARNSGLEKAEGEYIFFIDSDDWIEKNCIEIVEKKLQETHLNTVFFKAYVYWENSKTRSPIWYKNYVNFAEGKFEIDDSNMCYLPHYSWNKGYRREFLMNNNIRWQEGVIYEDLEFFFKVFINSPSTYMIDEALYTYRRRDDSIIGQCYNNLEHAEDLFTVTKNIKKMLVKRNLFEKYKNAFLQLVTNNLNNYRGFGDIHKKQVPLMLNCLNEINFSEVIERQSISEKQDETPLVSVVIPIYNVEMYIEECLISVANQTYKNLEIICVDDCGQDGSMKIVEQYAKIDKRIKIVKHEKNLGYCPAVNTGIENATGEYIFFVESDDFIESDCIETVTKKLIETRLNYVIFKIDRLELDGKRYSYHGWAKYYASLPEGYLTIGPENMNDFPYFYWNKGYKREFILQEKVKWQNGGIYEDQEFFYRVTTNSPETYIIDKSMYIYRIRESSLMGQCFGKIKKVEDLFNVMQRIVNYLHENNLFNKYKCTIPHLIYDNLKWYERYYNENPELCKMVSDFYKSINYPQAYIEGDNNV